MTATAAAPAARTLPGPPRRRLPALLQQLVGDRLSMMQSAATRYGDAVKIGVGPKKLYLFNHPDHAKHILADNAENYHKGIGLVQAKRALGDGLLTSDGELWRKQRKTIQPAFQPKRIAAQAGVIAQEGSKLVERLKAKTGGGAIDVVAEVTGLTLGVLGRALLDADLAAFDTIGHSFEAVQDQAMFEMVTLGMVPQRIPLPKQLRFREAREDLERIVERLVVERKRARDEHDGDDVIDRLINSTAQEPDPEVAATRMRDELVTVLLAGHETTASTLGWSLHLLDRHPEVFKKVHAEAVEVLGERLPEHDDLRRLTYTTKVVQEAMRLFPPVWILTRQAVADDVIDGYPVPAGADVLVCPYTMHRNPKFWEQPERFDPERFDAENSGARSRYSYIPFGAGPRFCVGSSLGMMEAVLVLAMVCRSVRLTTVSGYHVVAEPMLSLRIRGGLPMQVNEAS